jgi:hypothetical protein
METAMRLVVIGIMALFDLQNLSQASPDQRVGGEAAVIPSRVATAVCKAQHRLAEVIGRIQPGSSVHYATAGDWSMHDLLLHLLAQTGPAHVTASSWSISEPAAQQVIRAIEDGRILSLRLLVDSRAPTFSPEALRLFKGAAKLLRLTFVHAKVCVIAPPSGPALVVLSSMYWTNNPRIEAGVIVADPAAVAFHLAWLEAELAGASLFDAPASEAAPAPSAPRPARTGYSQRGAGLGVLCVTTSKDARGLMIGWKLAMREDTSCTARYADALCILIREWAPVLPAGSVVTCPPQGASAGGPYFAHALAAAVAARLGVPFQTLLSRTDVKTYHHPHAALQQTPFVATFPPGPLPAAVVIVDDLITSGFTMRLSLAAIRAAGVPAFGFAFAGY